MLTRGEKARAQGSVNWRDKDDMGNPKAEMLECFITFHWEGLLGTNTLAYYTHYLVMK